MQGRGIYRINMDRDWGLNDLYKFSHAFSQTYAFEYCFDSALLPRDPERIDYALEHYPWKGGFSIVNIYTILQAQVPPIHRPRLNSIHYASPGWIELLLNLDPAVKVAVSVATIAGSMAATTKAFAAIQETLQGVRLQRDKSKLEHLKITKAQATTLRGLYEEVSKLIGFQRFDELVMRTDGNVEVAAKLIIAQFRRLKTIAEYSKKGKVLLPQTPGEI